MPFFDIFASPRWSPLRMRTKVASFFIFFQEFSNKKKIKALRPKMTKIASRGGGSCLKSGVLLVWNTEIECRQRTGRGRMPRLEPRQSLEKSSITLSLAKNSQDRRWVYTPLPEIRTFGFSLHTSHLTLLKCSPLWRWNSQWVLTFRCQKIRPLCSDSVKWRDCSSHRKNESN